MYLLVWDFDHGFSNGTRTQECDTLEDVAKFLENHKHEMLSPKLYQQVVFK